MFPSESPFLSAPSLFDNVNLNIEAQVSQGDQTKPHEAFINPTSTHNPRMPLSALHKFQEAPIQLIGYRAFRNFVQKEILPP